MKRYILSVTLLRPSLVANNQDKLLTWMLELPGEIWLVMLKLPGESPHRRCSVSRRWSRHHLVANIVIAIVSVVIVTNNKMIILHDDGRCEH